MQRLLLSDVSDFNPTILIPSKDISRIYFLLHVFEAFVEAVGDDGAALRFEGGEVVHHAAAEEGGAVVEGGFVDDDLRALGFHALHDALDITLVPFEN